jgi:hypothetical protein
MDKEASIRPIELSPINTLNSEAKNHCDKKALCQNEPFELLEWSEVIEAEWDDCGRDFKAYNHEDRGSGECGDGDKKEHKEEVDEDHEGAN